MKQRMAANGSADTDLVEIVLSTYCGGEFLPQQLDSLLCQTHQKIRITIRDDESKDDTKAIIEAYGERYPGRINILSDSQGRLGSRNSFFALLQNSDANYIMFCDQDDVWLQDKVARSLFAIRRLEEKGGQEMPCMVFTDLIVVNETLSVISPSYWQYQRLNPGLALNWKGLAAQNVVTGCTMILNKAVKPFLAAHMGNELFHDHLCAVVCSKYGHVDFLREPSMQYRQHGANVSGAIKVRSRYLVEKILSIGTIIETLRATSTSFGGEVSVARLLFLKLRVNLLRALR